MERFRMDTPQVMAYFDDETGIVYVTYRGVLTPDITAQVYKWMMESVQFLDISQIHGGIYDFRQVTDFNKGNLATAHRESRNFNVKVDVSNIPAALIVSTLFQEQMVKISMQITPGQDRKRIVKSMDEATAFINQFRKRQTKTE
ncbi:MAG: hypothetical protein U0694_02790 [Anaerolineae bacterium]